MLMNKYNVLLIMGLIFSCHFIISMEAIIDEDITKRSKDLVIKHEDNERIACYDRIARYFVKYAPETPFNKTHEIFSRLEEPVQMMIVDNHVAKESPLIMFLTVPKDVFISVINTMVPDTETISTVRLTMPPGFTYDVNGYARRAMIMIGGKTKMTGGEEEVVETSPLKKKLLELPVEQAMCVIPRYTSREFQIKDMIERPLISKGSMVYDYQDNLFDELPGKEYVWSLEDIVVTTPQQQELLKAICTGHTEGRKHKNKRYCMTRDDTKLLMPIKDLILGNKLFSKMKINCAAEPATRMERFMNTVLHATPLFIISEVLPKAMYHTVNGKLQGFFGSIAVYVGGFLVGRYIYPVCDWGNSASRRASTLFGSDNRINIDQRWSFSRLSFMHYLFTCVAGRLISWGNWPGTIIGYGFHGIRAIALVCGTFDLRSYINPRTVWSLFPEVFTINTYNTVVQRRNKDNQSYTLEDLLKSPNIDNILKQ